VLAITTYSQDEQQQMMEHHKCTHDHQEMPEPELMDIEEDFNPEGNDHEGRTLASYSNLRTYGYYGGLSSASSTNRNYFQTKIFPPILDYFRAALKVKYPVSGKLKTSSSSMCGMSTSSALRSGVDADFVLMTVLDTSSSYVASSYACSLASGSKRPLFGKITISTRYMSATSDVLLTEKNMICIMHEVIHMLGFSKSLYGKWLTSSGKTLTGHIKSASLGGYTATVISAEPLLTRLRKFFGCSTLKGAYMENTGSSGTYGSHFERRQFAFEIMTSGLINQMQMSEFSLALLESTGWYVPDYSYADEFHFGKGQGCNFLTGSCSSSSFSEWCSGSARSCTNTGRGGGTCSSDTRSDGCKFIHPSVSYDCENPNADSYARLPALQSFGRTAGSKCFEGTLSSSSGASQSTYCFKYTCSGTGSSTKLTIKLGSSKTVVCTKAAKVTVSGYKGTVTCPDPQEWCGTVGRKVCPRNCMGRGTCNSGVCSCKSGFKGSDCAIPA
jgi:hypothetical protein